ncbi:MAG: 2-C-methyl-D-erythritol 4-phosphate cytidylyltransferase [Roseburia sp.]|nr:2-C-methyl-D-erythritol 4-phosphate cytidylyltransferase [Anaeroplasma bactoclasticum]MCM1196544.1 2-C-methyl-D-erythritol 4-phosphate cytidylyltransferase [Roseburia sp.]MCM1557632.1 2-C-methyl-D-erythritol 4-phosphate cytidylyltransferase [Anaeroplasma bactoclasticum]
MVSVVLMMAGNASRMHIKENKVFLPLGEKKVFEYALELFLSYSFEVICVIRKEDRQHLKNYESKVKIVYGGVTRQESVYNGLQEATEPYVLIHDAARPFISKRTVDACLKSLRENKACLVVVPCKDSLYQKTPLKTIERSKIVLAQTPQGGRTKDFLDVHQKALSENFQSTDDISLLLKYKDQMVELIESDNANFKITTQLDYITAKEWIKHV